MGTAAVIGAGTMGAGIAQVAASHGWHVELADVDAAIVAEAIDGVRKRLDRLVEKGRMTAEERNAAAARLRPLASPESFGACDIVIEAIVEDVDVKTRVLKDVVPHLRDDAIIATNTSSLSVTELAEGIGEARRTVGMHFFNPAPLLKLVEVIAGGRTDPAIVDRVAQIAEAWGKTVARAADVPGFIVNHVARPYYLEAFRILEDGYADPETIDRAMKELGGFRMGPLELTDLIGQDVNTATTRSVWERLDEPPLLKPSRLQESLVADSHLGRKTGRGVYDYTGDTQAAAIDVERRPLELSDDARGAVDDFAKRAMDAAGDELGRYVLARILAALIAQAAHARERGVATPSDIDIALRFGTNYPSGPFEWAERIGIDRVRRLLEHLNVSVEDDRFAAPPIIAASV